MNLGMHEELDRILLRKRFLRWAMKRPIGFSEFVFIVSPHAAALAERLCRWKPTYLERNPPQEPEMQ